MNIDKSMIESYIKKYGFNDFNNIDSFLGRWQENKSQMLMSLFGGELILEKEVIVEKGIDEYERELQKLLYNDGCRQQGFVKSIIQKLRDRDQYHMAGRLDELVNSNSLYNNSINEYLEYASEAEKIFGLPDGKDLKLKKDEKLMKVLRKLAIAYDLEEEFEEFRLAHSLVLNDKKLNGTLCLSIHPMDYLTMSDNDCGWSSCMSWKEDGCYKVGSMEMLFSSMVIVAYLKSSNSTLKFDNYEWNSKKWRELVIITPDAIINDKSYPYKQDNLNVIVMNWIKDLMQNNMNIKMNDKLFWCEDGCCEDNTNFEINFNGFMYNDFQNDSGYFKMYKRQGFFNIDDICIDGEGVCLQCGGSLDREDSFICDDCQGIKTCVECGSRMSEDDEKVFINDNWYCAHCARELEEYKCVVCGKIHNHSKRVIYRSTEKEYDEKELDMCYDCFLTYRREDIIIATLFSNTYYITELELSNSNKKIFREYIDKLTEDARVGS